MKVVLLHAWPLDEHMWEPHLAWLRAEGHDAVAPRLYGRGPSLDGWAAELLAAVEGSFVAVGASMGGSTALALARRAPERVVGLALAGTRAEADSAERRARRGEIIAELRSRGAPRDAAVDATAEELALAQEALRDRVDATGVARAFGGPVLVCVGDRDELVSVDDARALAGATLRGTLVVFDGAGHLPSVEQPDRFAAVLREFLGQWRT